MPLRTLVLALATLAAVDAHAFTLQLVARPEPVAAAPSWLIPAEVGGGTAVALLAVPLTYGIGKAFALVGLGAAGFGGRLLLTLLGPALGAAGTVIALADLDPALRPRWGPVMGVTGGIYVAILVGTSIYAGSFVEGLFYGLGLIANGQYFAPYLLLTSALLGVGATIAANVLNEPRRQNSMWKKPKETDPDEDPFSLARPPAPASATPPAALTSLAWSRSF